MLDIALSPLRICYRLEKQPGLQASSPHERQAMNGRASQGDSLIRPQRRKKPRMLLNGDDIARLYLPTIFCLDYSCAVRLERVESTHYHTTTASSNALTQKSFLKGSTNQPLSTYR
jgi:hypothetical protein